MHDFPLDFSRGDFLLIFVYPVLVKGFTIFIRYPAPGLRPTTLGPPLRRTPKKSLFSLRFSKMRGPPLRWALNRESLSVKEL